MKEQGLLHCISLSRQGIQSVTILARTQKNLPPEMVRKLGDKPNVFYLRSSFPPPSVESER